jgi:predicted Fe-Mo cluster-binding NifX family protein
MEQKVLIALYGDQVAPRFDLATEVHIFQMAGNGELLEQKTVVLPRASAEQLCHLVLVEKIQTVICGGIEDEYYKYLTWKNVSVFDSVVGSYKAAIKRLQSKTLRPGDIIRESIVRRKNGTEPQKLV